MAQSEERGPQRVTNEEETGLVGGQGPRDSASLSNAYAQAQAQAGGTPSLNVVTRTTVEEVGSSMTTAPAAAAAADDSMNAASEAETTDGLNGFTAPSASQPTDPGTTFATQTSRPSGSNLQQTLSPDTSESSGKGNGGLSPGQLAAVIVAPIAAAAFLALLAFFILRRRRRSRQEQPQPDTSSSSTSRRRFFGLRERWGSLKSISSSQHEKRHNTDLTGRDTSSRSEPPHDEPPPVPVDPTAAPPLTRGMTNFSHPRRSKEMTQLQIPQHRTSSSLPISPLSASDLLTPNPSFLRLGRPASTRSIDSDAYSDTASIHSARAARMSVGGPTMISPGPHANGSKSGSLGDPFDDPNTPVPSLPGDALRRLEGRSRHGSAESQISKTSEISKSLDV